LSFTVTLIVVTILDIERQDVKEVVLLVYYLCTSDGNNNLIILF